jgi:hypothetical protein
MHYKRDIKLEHTYDPKVYFIGSFDWLPNREGMKWFIKKVIPMIEFNQNIDITIAGRNYKNGILPYHKNIKYVG